jgi:hypothetical protein
MHLLIFFGFVTIYLIVFIFSFKLKTNMLCNIFLLVSDIIILHFTLFLYEYPWVGRVTADFWILVCIIINIIFFVRCIFNRKFIYLILALVPIILLILLNNRFDRNVLLYSKLFSAKNTLKNIIVNNEEISNIKNINEFIYDENKLYIIHNFGKWDTLEATDLMDPICVIVYDEKDNLNNYLDYDYFELEGTNGVKEYVLGIRVLKKLWKGWYYCVF